MFYFYEHSLQSFFRCIHFQILQSWLLKKTRLTWIQIFDTFFTQRCKVALDNIATLLGVVNICKVSYLSLNFFLILENKYIVHSSNFKISWGSKNLQILHPKIKQEGHLYCIEAKKFNIMAFCNNKKKAGLAQINISWMGYDCHIPQDFNMIRQICC